MDKTSKLLQERELKRKMFYASLGECITARAAIERVLFKLFHRALDANEEKSALIFWAIPTFGIRLSHTSMFVMHCLKIRDGSETKTRQYWKKLRNDLEKLHSFKNYLAHQPTTKDKIEEDDMVIPNDMDKKKAFEPITHSDLEVHLKTVSAINGRLFHLTSEFRRLEEIALETFSGNED
jgi:hypothetical protein